MIVKSAVFGSMQNNCYLIVDESTNASALVDCPEFSQQMIDFIGNTDLQYILLTHGHFDHIGGVADVKQKYSCAVAISQPDEQMLSSSRHSLAAFCGAFHKNANADIILSDGDIITLGNTKISVMATPGHTKGGLCFIADNNIFSGDTLFYLSCGRTDFPGGSVSEIKNSLKALASLNGSYNVYPGHSQFTNLDFERQNNPYMK